MSFMGKKEIDDNMKELKDEKKTLQTKINNWETDEMKKTHPELWITQLNEYTKQMIGLDNRLKGLEDTLGKLSMEEQKQSLSNEQQSKKAVQYRDPILKKIYKNSVVLASGLSHLILATINPWRQSRLSHSSSRPSDFRLKIIKKYEVGVIENDQLKKADNGSLLSACMVTSIIGNGDSVIAAHIIPVSITLSELRVVGVTSKEIKSARNGLMLCKGIEHAFDQLRLSFIPNDPLDNRTLVLKCWDPSLNDEVLYPGLAIERENMIGFYDGKPLRFKDNPLAFSEMKEIEAHREPFKPLLRGLSYHAALSYENACACGFIDEVEIFPPDSFGSPSKFGNLNKIVEEDELEEEDEEDD